MTRKGELASNPLAHNEEDSVLVAEFKERFASAMGLVEIGSNEETPLQLADRWGDVMEVSDSRRLDALATIMASRAIQVLEGLTGPRTRNMHENLAKKRGEL